METTIRLNTETKQDLDKFKQYKNESYNELIRKLIYIAKMCEKEPKLSKKTIQEIKEARERIKVTWVRKPIGLIALAIFMI